MSRRKPASSIWHPRYWLTWLTAGLMRGIAILPFDWQIAIGRVIGVLGFHLAASRRHITNTNIALCFPNRTEAERDRLSKDVLINSGIGLFETNFAWNASVARISERFEFEGLEHLISATENGTGVLLLGMHFSTLDLCGAALTRKVPFQVMYRRNKNPVVEKIMSGGREKNFPAAIERANIRGVIKALKNQQVVWYGPDQDYGRKQSVFAPFFNIQAATITATARIAKMTGAKVVPFYHKRLIGNRYRISLGAPLDGFPSGDDIADAARVNRIVEDAILEAPDQYWWVHRRFKTRPEGEARPY